ncbi:tRNA (adenosine(37)-N6)-threonylcarbamoyltransferase complex ATPase subunit type 1 TsaE [Pseudoalteromonas xiamenensis]|uniref:tRNA (adenosine(37)-N6)-threonylcarbamoyltransferase complex ATPase subunit type 1 TsaE n=1 Tax=Pseudoalteromonas xiamenensis TaxID=882626 RepID=UPI0027E54418|nr:tRNA (adenosine(37)-N6)-threonylcarbamoyltransferase complex ATPase subunit type 1 TsaE [Pseudoalteromonas xiamenensis]WMN61139.1 tRNA (adenosine(37)-N6)-threonylcarbamoyltransferase complex ATPase subunit type 1 TsaE [Pseudoalteromonas xiamenensis]
MNLLFSRALENEDATVAMGRQLAAVLHLGGVIYLKGDLGAGKTTLSRGVVQGLGHTGKVKSPTYTLVEPYELERINVYHFDLYRLGDPEELEYMGIRDYFSPETICIVEWPDKGTGFIPKPDLDIEMRYVGDAREIAISACSSRGQELIEKLQSDENK